MAIVVEDMVRGGGRIRFNPPPPPINLNFYEGSSREMTISYGVIFLTATETNETLGHNCHKNI